MKNLGTLFRLEGRVALVVGAASGIGASAARGLAAHGAEVWCADLNSRGLAPVVAEIRRDGGSAEPLKMNLLDKASVARGVRKAARKTGGLDILVLTPGINVRKPLLEYTDEEMDRVLSLNLKGAVRALREAGKLMADAGRGSIILLSSIRSQVVEPGQGVYAATKAGIVQLARALAAELGPRGVRVNALAPGIVHTPLTSPIRSHKEWYSAYASKNALGRWAEPDEMAGPIVFLASDASSYVTGAVLFADGGWTAVDGRFHPPL